MAVIISANSSRLDDGPLALGIERFEGPNGKSLWRLKVSRYCGGAPLLEQDLTTEGARALRTFADRALEALTTDGGRSTATTDA
ncbi:MAG: hypothetical protein VR70_14515 [Rhodospirillaceae bacterium BRH_c57]|nr:MAG: hypothetical protein VR70_15390 [Rhodospirillaceae bacterium BRH_c57]KJS36093.1 MAG: hypothetical protein VR70_14515 [Rhodospirillaceae bacterium BRH_c57]